MGNKKRMLELISTINTANKAYYNTGTELISNHEWDMLYDELQALEEQTGLCLSNSPTQKVGYEVASSLPKEKHAVPALSLDKTKNIDQLAGFVGSRETVLSWKLDGLTVVLTYESGKLTKAVTRGNGTEGEVITNNARCFANIPLTIPDNADLTIRGEALITYEDFNRINSALPEGEEKYKNPRNLCSGSVRQLDPAETKRRNVKFIAFALAKGNHSIDTRSGQLAYLRALGFDVVEHVVVKDEQGLKEQVSVFAAKMEQNPFPSDGLVLQYDNIAYGESLGVTSKYPRDSIAFKWEDEEKETTLLAIEWSASRTGLINPVAVFEPVELEGTTVTRASVHNVSIVRKLSLTPGDRIKVYKANMIIPQISKNLTRKGVPRITPVCPVCGESTVIRTSQDGAQTLWCSNKRCGAKHIGAFTHAVGRDALNIEGLSEETITKFVNAGILAELTDLFHLKEHKDTITAMDGFGEKSYAKLTENMEKARHTNLQKLIYALGIDNVGRTASKAICMHFEYDVISVVNASKDQLLEIQDIGDVIAESFVAWFKDIRNQELFEGLLEEVDLERPRAAASTPLTGKTFVITGSLNHFKNRDALKAKIEELGGKVSGSVSAKTSYLVNNDISSTSGKNKKAKSLGIPIITEDKFLEMI